MSEKHQKPLSENLHSLIKSLQKSEKRHLKLVLNNTYKKESKRYTLLFDAIDKQEVYDDEKLYQQMHELCQMNRGQLATIKYLLYQITLKHLRNLYADKGDRFKVREMLDMVEILFRKQLFRQCSRTLNKAKKLIKEQQLHEYRLAAWRWEFRLAPYATQADRAETVELTARNRSQELAHTQELAMLTEQVTRLKQLAYAPRQALGDDLIALIRTWDEEARQRISPARSSSFFARFCRFEIIMFCRRWLPESEDATGILHQLWEAFAAEPQEVQFHADYVALALFEHLHFTKIAVDSALLTNFLRLFDELSISSEYGRQIKDHLHQHLQLFLHLHQTKHAASKLNAVADMLVGEQDLELPGNLLQPIGEGLVKTYFLLDNPSAAIRILNDLLREYKNTLAPHQLDEFLVWEFIMHYQLENFSLEEHLYRATMRQLKGRPYDTPALQRLMKLLKKLFHGHKGSRLQEILREISQQLEELDTTEHLPNGCMLMAWVKGQGANTPTLKVYRQITNHSIRMGREGVTKQFV